MAYTNEFQNLAPQLSAQDIADVEAEIGTSLPQDLRLHYLQYNGGSPKRAFCRTSDGSEVCVHGFMPMRYGANDLLFETAWRWHKVETPFLPEHFIPFAYDSGGEYFCYSTDGEKPGAIYHFWSEFADDLERAVSFVAPSLEVFINSLEDDDNV